MATAETSTLFLTEDVIEAATSLDPPGRCMTFAERQDAVSGPLDGASGWYGPGAYLAWLLTAYMAAFPSIWHAKCSKENEQSGEILDGEMLAAILYPLIALFDLLSRLVRCQIDPGINAPVFVLLSSLTIIGPVARLSERNGEIDVEAIFPKTRRSWAWKTCGFLIHGVIITIAGEPYSYGNELVVTIYTLLFVLMLYSLIHGERLTGEYPYRQAVHRPRLERIVVFSVFQVIFGIVAYSKTGSFFPPTDASLFDLDQVGSLVSVAAAILYSRRETAVDFVLGGWYRMAGFRLLGRPGNTTDAELEEVVVA
jgi:hypothetical protein